MGTRVLDPVGVLYGPDGLVAAIVQDVADGRVLMVAWQDAEAIEATLRTGEAHFHSRSRDVLWRKGETSGNTLAVESMELDCDGDAVLIRARPAGPTCHTEARSCFDVEPDAGAPASRDSAPDARDSAPDARDSAPDAQDSAPDAQDSAPDAQDSAPAPDAQDSAPDAQDSAPDAQDSAPDAQDSAPDAQDSAPDAQDSAPDAQDSAPDAQDSAPDAQDSAPDAQDSAPDAQDFAWLERLWDTIEERARTRPEGSYTSSLLESGVDATARKVAEEATEVVMAAKDDAVAERSGAERPHEELAGELADLLYHSLVLCAERGLPPSEVIDTLKRRHAA